MTSEHPPIRVAVYVDGFNLYYGLKSKMWRKYYWLDLASFSQVLAQDRQVVSVKYFTADIGGNLRKVQRQQAFLGALSIAVSEFLEDLVSHLPALQLLQQVG